MQVHGPYTCRLSEYENHLGLEFCTFTLDRNETRAVNFDAKALIRACLRWFHGNLASMIRLQQPSAWLTSRALSDVDGLHCIVARKVISLVKGRH
jgi:hypothetical protein